MSFQHSEHLANWFHSNKRDLPWRYSQDPYQIWLSEIILQQTRIMQGLSYFNHFIRVYPTVSHLAAAPLDEVMRGWQGLGYYSRARHMHETAKTIAASFNGIFPASYKELIRLKGIGPYTAAAISSIAYNEPVAVVDGNVFRVLSRYTGNHTPIDTARGKKEFNKLAGEFLNRQDPGTHNQALMELGALVCKPRNPSCEVCPIKPGCYAFRKGCIADLPVKEGIRRIRRRYFNYFFIIDSGHTYITQRADKDIWRMLFEFPLVETPEECPVQDLTSHAPWTGELLEPPSCVRDIRKYRHLLTHREILCTFYLVEKPFVAASKTSLYKRISLRELSMYALPRIIGRYLQDLSADGFPV